MHMHMKQIARWRAVLAVLPCLPMLIAAACASADTNGFYGEGPRTAALFCDIPLGRECASPADIAMGIDLARPDEEGFFVGRSSAHAIDYSPEATAQCGGGPMKVRFRGPFPDGEAICVSPGRLGLAPDGGDEQFWDSVDAACRTLGNESMARASHRASQPFRNACTDAGTLRTNFRDPRRMPPVTPVTWVNGVNVVITGSSIGKATAGGAYDAGAAAMTILPAGEDGLFEFTANETDTERMAGFAKGALPDVDPSNADITYGLVLQKGGLLLVVENGQTTMTTSYASGDRLGIAVVGGVLYYSKNGQPIATGGSTGGTVLRVSASLLDANATIANAATTF